MYSFKQNLDLFYKVEGRSFLTKDRNNIGGEETFYMHYLKFYMPMIAEVTLQRHQMGLGIFKMQGIERRNKESKNTLGKFCNMKGNFLSQNLNRLYYIFKYDCNGY